MSRTQIRWLIRLVGIYSLFLLILRSLDFYGIRLITVVSDGSVLVSIAGLVLWMSSEWAWMNEG